MSTDNNNSLKTDSPIARSQRRRYAQPQVTAYGNLTELTLGATGGTGEDMGEGEKAGSGSMKK